MRTGKQVVDHILEMNVVFSDPDGQLRSGFPDTLVSSHTGGCSLSVHTLSVQWGVC